jgi:hypothetical protein
MQNSMPSNVDPKSGDFRLNCCVVSNDDFNSARKAAPAGAWPRNPQIGGLHDARWSEKTQTELKNPGGYPAFESLG